MTFLLRNFVLAALLVNFLLLGELCNCSSVQSNGRQKRALPTCTSTGSECAAIPNSNCDGTNCVCDTGYVENTGTNACDVATLGGACTKVEDCSLIGDASCDIGGTGKCVCNAGFTDDGLGGCTGGSATPIICPVPQSASNNAVITCSATGTANDGDTCSYTCNQGYTDSGSGTIACGDNGSGTGEFTTPTCTLDGSGTAQTCTLPASSSNNAAIDCSSASTPDATEGEKCTYSCDAGYTDAGNGEIICTGGAFETPSCQAITCPALSAPDNGNAPSCTDGVNLNSVCTFTCMDGFSVTGTATSTCTSDGTSATGSFGSTPTCEVGCTETCDANAACTGTDSTVFTCACNVGYTGNGTVCSATGGAVGINSNSGFFVLLPAFLMVLSAIFLN